jgi:acyl-CoA thioester hydrolase
MPRSDFAFHHDFRVRWSETDAQGVVFNARYLDYADVAISEYWRAMGWKEGGEMPMLECHVRKATVLFEAPIKPDEMITVMARTLHIGNSSMTQLVEIHGVNTDGKDDLRATIELVAVHVDLDTHTPQTLPDWARSCMTEFDAKARQVLEGVG